jgi:hypothetical protein
MHTNAEWAQHVTFTYSLRNNYRFIIDGICLKARSHQATERNRTVLLRRVADLFTPKDATEQNYSLHYIKTFLVRPLL